MAPNEQQTMVTQSAPTRGTGAEIHSLTQYASALVKNAEEAVPPCLTPKVSLLHFVNSDEAEIDIVPHVYGQQRALIDTQLQGTLCIAWVTCIDSTPHPPSTTLSVESTNREVLVVSGSKSSQAIFVSVTGTGSEFNVHTKIVGNLDLGKPVSAVHVLPRSFGELREDEQPFLLVIRLGDGEVRFASCSSLPSGDIEAMMLEPQDLVTSDAVRYFSQESTTAMAVTDMPVCVSPASSLRYEGTHLMALGQCLGDCRIVAVDKMKEMTAEQSLIASIDGLHSGRVVEIAWLWHRFAYIEDDSQHIGIDRIGSLPFLITAGSDSRFTVLTPQVLQNGRVTYAVKDSVEHPTQASGPLRYSSDGTHVVFSIDRRGAVLALDIDPDGTIRNLRTLWKSDQNGTNDPVVDYQFMPNRIDQLLLTLGCGKTVLINISTGQTVDSTRSLRKESDVEIAGRSDSCKAVNGVLGCGASTSSKFISFVSVHDDGRKLVKNAIPLDSGLRGKAQQVFAHERGRHVAVSSSQGQVEIVALVGRIATHSSKIVLSATNGLSVATLWSAGFVHIRRAVELDGKGEAISYWVCIPKDVVPEITCLGVSERGTAIAVAFASGDVAIYMPCETLNDAVDSLADGPLWQTKLETSLLGPVTVIHVNDRYVGIEFEGDGVPSGQLREWRDARGDVLLPPELQEEEETNEEHSKRLIISIQRTADPLLGIHLRDEICVWAHEHGSWTVFSLTAWDIISTEMCEHPLSAISTSMDGTHVLLCCNGGQELYIAAVYQQPGKEGSSRNPLRVPVPKLPNGVSMRLLWSQWRYTLRAVSLEAREVLLVCYQPTSHRGSLPLSLLMAVTYTMASGGGPSVSSTHALYALPVVMSGTSCPPLFIDNTVVSITGQCTPVTVPIPSLLEWTYTLLNAEKLWQELMASSTDTRRLTKWSRALVERGLCQLMAIGAHRDGFRYLWTLRTQWRRQVQLRSNIVDTQGSNALSETHADGRSIVATADDDDLLSIVQCSQWHRLGEAAMKALDFESAIPAFRMASAAHLVNFLEDIAHEEDLEVLSGYVAMWYGQHGEAERHFMAANRPEIALEMHRNVLDFDKAMALARDCRPGDLPFLSAARARQLEIQDENAKARILYQSALIDTGSKEAPPRVRLHNTQCLAGQARTAIAVGEAQEGIALARQEHERVSMLMTAAQANVEGEIGNLITADESAFVSDRAAVTKLLRECGALLENRSQFIDASDLYSLAGIHDRAAQACLRGYGDLPLPTVVDDAVDTTSASNTAGSGGRRFAYLSDEEKDVFLRTLWQIVPQLTSAPLTVCYGRCEERKGTIESLERAFVAYERAGHYASAVRVLLYGLGGTPEALQRATELVHVTGSRVGAKAVADWYLQKLEDVSRAIEFLLLSAHNEEAFRMAIEHDCMDIFAELLGDRASKEEHLAVAEWFATRRDPTRPFGAGYHYVRAGFLDKGVDFLTKTPPPTLAPRQLSDDGTGVADRARPERYRDVGHRACRELVRVVRDILYPSGDTATCDRVWQFLTGGLDGKPRPLFYQVRYHLATGQPDQAMQQSLAVTQSLQDEGAYRKAHNMLVSLTREFAGEEGGDLPSITSMASSSTYSQKTVHERGIALALAVPPAMRTLMHILHSYVLVRTLVKHREHERAARLLCRTAQSISMFPNHVVPILTSTVIECTRAGLKRSAHRFASMLMQPTYRDQIDPKYRKKIELIVRKPEAHDEVPDSLSECPYCATLVPDRQLTCVECRSLLPMCVASGCHVVRHDLTLTPCCAFPARYSEYSVLLAKEGTCCLCGQTANSQVCPPERIAPETNALQAFFQAYATASAMTATGPRAMGSPGL
eukprot:Clim_evm40s148 gene=Clim_evmTU40s148